MMEKQGIRKKMLDLRKCIKKENKQLYDRRIFEHVCRLPEYLNSNLVLSYVSMNSEADTINLINLSLKNGKAVAVPKVLEDGGMDFYLIKGLNELKRGVMGILEPKSIIENSISQMIHEKKISGGIMLVPGLAFDIKMNRLGYGGGYYDRYLSYIKDEHIGMTKAALLYECQIAESIPTDRHDMKMDMLITPDRVYMNVGGL